MKIILLCLFITWGSWFCDAARKKRVVGGSRVKIEEVPYQALLDFVTDEATDEGTFVETCGAIIIHKYWLLTAAHCVDGYVGKPEAIVVRTGTDEFDDYSNTHDVDYIVQHPQYRGWFILFDNDIALLKLKAPINFNTKQTAIPIASPTDIPEENQPMLISGFGDIDDNETQSDFLRKAYVPVTSQQKCKEAYTIIFSIDTITDNMFCAGNGVIDACDGDSGGPGVINGTLYGIVTKGQTCPSKVGVYTRVHLYHNWIAQTTGIKF